MNIAYVRVSTIEQNEDRQIEALKKYDIERWYIDKISGKDMNRPKLQEMLSYIREGDTVFIHDLSRIARSTEDLLSLVNSFQEKRVHLVSNKENINTTTPTGKLMLTMIGAINEFERANLLERQREGILIAKQNGKYTGRKKITVGNFEEYYERYANRQATKTALAKELSISRPTLDRLIADFRAQKISHEFNVSE